ncbi:MAG: ribosome silencing factor [Ruminococcus sp.]|nr:ribosome silencing factor [Ruminococcus sp.]
MTAFDTAIKAAQLFSDKKCKDISVIKISDVSSLADYMVIATGNNSTHVKALADEVEVALKEQGRAVDHIEGHRTESWVLLDYSDVIINVFSDEAREYYGLERLWQSGEAVDLSDYISD